MATTGFLIPAARTIDAGSGTWTNDANIHADDGAEATFSLAVKNTSGRWLRGQTFGFDSAIPAGATIDQVNLRMEYRVNSTGGIAQPQCQSFVSGVAVGAVRTASPLEPTVLTLNTFDVTADRAWVRADLLNGTFEMRIRGTNGNSATDPSYRWDYIAVEVVYSVGQTVNANQVTETETSQALTVDRVVASAEVVEVETTELAPSVWDNAASWDNAMPWTHPSVELRKTVIFGQTTETETAQAVTINMGGGQTIPLAQTTETETAQTVTLRKTETATQTTETETAQPVTLRKTETAAQIVETETAQSVTLRKTETAGQPAETETAQPVTLRKTETLGQVVETELAQGITLGGVQNIPLGQALETETSQPVTLDKIVQLDNLYDDILGEFYFTPVETETAQTITVRATRSFTLATAVEVETAAALTVVGGAPAFTPGFSTATVTLAAGGSSTITGPNGSASVSKRPTGAASIR